MSQYFPKPDEPFGEDINVTVDLSNYATNIDFKKEVNDKLQEYFCERVYAKLVTRNY